MACFSPNFPANLVDAAGNQVYTLATQFHTVLPNGNDAFPVKFIGAYLSNRLATSVTARHPAGIHTVAHLRAECAGRSRRVIERLLSELAANARPNRCVDDITTAHPVRRYHSSLINQCGFNVLLALVRVVNAAARRSAEESGRASDQPRRRLQD